MNSVLEKTKIQEVDVFNICKQLGVPCYLNGYLYIKMAIMKIVDNENYIYNNGMVGIYKDIAEELGISWNRVERSMKHAIEKAFLHADMKTVSDIFGASCNDCSGKVTNATFIANIYEYLKYQKERR